MRARLLFVVAIILVILSAGAGIWFGLRYAPNLGANICCAQIGVRQQLPVIAHGLTPRELYDSFYENVSETGERNGARSAIVAHHLIVGKEIAHVFETIGDRSVSRVILVSPNHFDAGSGPALVAKAIWSTPYGEVSADTEAVDRLVKEGVVKEDTAAFVGEHGINAITPFVKRSFPNAQIVPIMVHESLAPEDAERLASALREEMNVDAVFIASIDMSHNLPIEVQKFHDDLTELTLESGVLKHDLEIDSNADLRVLFELNRLLGTRVWNQTYRGSSLGMGAAKEWIENTSHLMGYFTKGEPVAHEWTSFLFGGDIMLDRGTRKQIMAADPARPLGDPTYPWRNLKRFTMGVDLRVANLEGTVNEQPSSYTYDPPFRFVFDPLYVEAMKPYIDIVSLANNHAADVGASVGQEETHQWLDRLNIPWFGKWETPEPAYDFEIRDRKYRLVGYHAFKPDIEALESLIREGKAEGRFVIVMPHWGIEYEYEPFYGQTDLAQRMVNAGADLVIGGHPHVVQGMDILTSQKNSAEQVPVVYSLGNFVFDQRTPVTWDAMALGIIHTEDSLMLYLLPIGTKNSQPIPYGATDAARVLNIVANASPEALRKSILESKITILYGDKKDSVQNVQ